MIISPPFLPAAGLNSTDPTETDPMMAAVESFELPHEGIYPIAFDRRWHCGSHLAPSEQTEPVRAIADGEVIAYRVSKNAITDGHIDPDTRSPALNSNAGFVLLKHVTDTGDGRTITFYSLYMHLLDMTNQHSIAHQPSDPPTDSSPTGLPAWLLDTAGGKDGTVQSGNGRKVWRKDMLGYAGRCHDMTHLHFEIFMTAADFTAWFGQAGHTVQLGVKNPVTPASKDYWGHSYFVIPGGQSFASVPPGQHDSTYFPALTSGTLDARSTLYVEAYFHKGERYIRSWVDRGDGKITPLTASPVRDRYAEYEYKLYQRATALYPACPSDGYELLRFGRILGTDQPTLPATSRGTWVAVPFDENGTQGYIDISQGVIQKLSDADFPFFMGWQKIEDINTPLDEAGLWRFDELRKLVGDATADQHSASQTDPEFTLDDNLTGYVHGSDAVRARLKGFVCHAPSEWDTANNDPRYKELNEPDGFFGSRADTDPDGYNKFLGFLKKFQFLDQTSLAGGQKFWFFHPLAFIRHFRKCGWLSRNEMFQMFPMTALRPAANHQWVSERVTILLGTVDKYRTDLNKVAQRYGIVTPTRMAAFYANAMQETTWFGSLAEGEDKKNPQRYLPWQGRGFLQLTWPKNYIMYWRFVGRQVSDDLEKTLDAATRKANKDRTDVALKAAEAYVSTEMKTWRNNDFVLPDGAADSAGAYWIWSLSMQSADKTAPNVFTVQVAQVATAPRQSHSEPVVYYSNEAFGAVAATVNVGSPRSNYGSVNGIVARFQAFISAQMVFLDMPLFPDSDGISRPIPEKYTPRRP
jgi:hypothetical protein